MDSGGGSETALQAAPPRGSAFGKSTSTATIGLSEPTSQVERDVRPAWQRQARRYGKQAFKLFKYTWSLALLVFSLVLILWSIGIGTTAFYPGSPVWLNYILFVLFLGLLGVLEGTMISLSQLRKAPRSSYEKGYKYTLMNTSLAFRPDYLERFLMGRQICVIILVFVLARLTTVLYVPGFEGWLTNAFLVTGLFGAFIVLIIGNLVPQILAAKFSVLFLNFLAIHGVIRFCLFVRWTGLPHACWLCARALAGLLRLPFDGPADKKTSGDDTDAPTTTTATQANGHSNGHGEGAQAAAETQAPVDPDAADLDELGASMLPMVGGQHEGDAGHQAYVNSHLLDVHVKTVLPRRPVRLQSLPPQVEQALALNTDRQLATHEAPITAQARLFATVDEVADLFRAAGEPVPPFLRARTTDGAEPAFVAALRLLAEYEQLRNQAEVGKKTPAPAPATDIEAPAPAPADPTAVARALAPIVQQAQLARVKAPV
jgi:hypothetical protein